MSSFYVHNIIYRDVIVLIMCCMSFYGCKLVCSFNLSSKVQNRYLPLGEANEAILGCKIWLGKEKMEEVNEFRYLGTIDFSAT